MLRATRVIFDISAALALMLCAAVGVARALASRHSGDGSTLQFTHAQPADLAARHWQISLDRGQLFARLAVEQFESEDNLHVLVAHEGLGGWRISPHNDKGWEYPVWLEVDTRGFHFKHSDEQPGYGVTRSRQWLVALPAWALMLVLSIVPMARAMVWIRQHRARSAGPRWFRRHESGATTIAASSRGFPRSVPQPRLTRSPFVTRSPGNPHAPSPMPAPIAPRRRRAG